MCLGIFCFISITFLIERNTKNFLIFVEIEIFQISVCKQAHSIIKNDFYVKICNAFCNILTSQIFREQ